MTGCGEGIETGRAAGAGVPDADCAVIIGAGGQALGGGTEGQAPCSIPMALQDVAEHAWVVTIVGVHVEVWNLPAVDAGICPTTVTVFTVAAQGYCQHGAPRGYKGGDEQLSVCPSPIPPWGP